MLPSNPYPAILNNEVEMPTKTYRLDVHQKRILGYVDGLPAMVQAVQKIFETERFAWNIYTQNYGIELEGLIGKEFDFVISILESRIKDALLADDRILSLQDFKIESPNKSSLTATGRVITTQGALEFREELSI